MTRTVMTGTALALALAMLFGGCKDNEQSFYIEHLKALPEPPECKVSTGDPVIPEITVDLALAGTSDFYAWFQVTNALMARENYDNLKAESNGIFIEGAETVVSIGGQATGGSEYRDVNIYLEPESSDVVPGIVLTAEAFQSLGVAQGCTPLEDSAFAVSVDLTADGVLDTMPMSESLGTGYGEVRFVGHTQGGIEVETNPFSFAIALCCNCFIDWSEVADPCEAFCEDTTEYSSCAWGVNAGNSPFPAHNMTHNPSAEWDDSNADAGTDCEQNC